MLELKFVAPGLKGKTVKFKINDSSVRYLLLMLRCSEDVCIEALENLKRRSGKKCAVAFGNCQAATIQDLLLKHPEFMREYFILELPFEYDYHPGLDNNLFANGAKFLQLVDLFIAQPIERLSYWKAFMSAKKFIEKLRTDTKIVIVPDFDFRAYFPQYVRPNPRNKKMEVHQNGIFPFADKYVDEIMEHSGMNPDVEKILDTISDENFISAEKIQKNIDESLDKLKKDEWICDVKMSDYVENNFRFKQIFFAPTHPSPLVMVELTRRILRFIGMKSDIFLNYSNFLDDKSLAAAMIGTDEPIYPAVKKFFKLEESLEKYYAAKWTWDFRADFRDFMRQYILECWAEKFSR